MTFGSYFRDLRRKRGLTQGQAAAKSGIALRTLIYWEKETCNPRLPELHAALTALGASDAETAHCLRLLNTLRTIQLVQEQAQETAPLHIGLLPHKGDFLKTLRIRQGWNLEQAGEAVGVHLTTLARWERMESAPPAEDLSRVCALLGAAPEEARALASPYLARLPRPAEAVSLEDWRGRIAAFQHQTEMNQTPLIDLMALMLRRELWCVAVKNTQAQNLLAELDTYYAQWLILRNRSAEAERYARQALQSVAGRFAPEYFWTSAIQCLAVSAVEKPVRAPAQGYRIYRRWESYFTEPGHQARVYHSMAEYASQSGRDTTALALLDDADALIASRPDSASLHRAHTARARIYTRNGRMLEALELLPPAPGDGLVSRLVHSSLWTNALRKAGESHIAHGFLTNLYTDIATYQAQLYKPFADELASEL